MIYAKIKNLIAPPITGEWGSKGNKVKVLRSTNFTNEGVLNLNDIATRDVSDKKIEKKNLKPGDIILEKSGGSPNQPVGRVVYFDLNNDTYLCTNFTSIIRPIQSKVYPKYLFYLLFANHKLGITEYFQQKTTGIINLRLNQYINRIEIPLPPLSAQKKIAAILDKAQALIDNDKKVLEKYDQLAQSVFLEMFGDPYLNTMNWKKVKTIDVCDSIVPGRTKPKSFTGAIPWITLDDLNILGRTSESTNNKGLSENEIKKVKAKIIPKESVIMSCVGDLGMVSICNKEIVMNQQLHAFICSDEINNTFLMYNLIYQKPYMYKMATSTTVPYMNKTVCNNTPTILPPISLQNKFDEIINNLDYQKNQAQRLLQKSEELFNSLLQKAFKGELVE